MTVFVQQANTPSNGRVVAQPVDVHAANLLVS